jgi:4-amino-4-deoxy-L-arabinose transferase-like glycosyltransferase
MGVYLTTLAPTVYTLDSAELATAAYSLGLMHSPGYAVHLLLLHGFLYLPFGDVGYRSNLFSAIAGVIMIWFVLRLCRTLYQQWVPAVVASLSLAFCFYVWSVAVVAEVYTLQGCFLAALLLLLWHWRQTGQMIYLTGAVGLQGLALANSPATALWLPGLLILALATPQCRQLHWRHIAGLSGVFALALLPVLYLPWRSLAQPAFINVGAYDATGTFHAPDLATVHGLLAYLSGQQFESLFFADAMTNFPTATLDFFRWLVAAFLGVGLPLGLWGIWMLMQHARIYAIGLVIVLVLHALFFISYGAVDKATMFLPVYLIWAIFIGAGVRLLADTFNPYVAKLALLLPLTMLIVNMPFVRLHNAWEPAHTAQQRLEDAAPDALYLASWGEAEMMRYYQIVAETRTDVQVVNVFFVDREIQPHLINHALQQQRPVYITTRLESIIQNHRDNASKVDGGYRLLYE